MFTITINNVQMNHAQCYYNKIIHNNWIIVSTYKNIIWNCNLKKTCKFSENFFLLYKIHFLQSFNPKISDRDLNLKDTNNIYLHVVIQNTLYTKYTLILLNVWILLHMLLPNWLRIIVISSRNQISRIMRLGDEVVIGFCGGRCRWHHQSSVSWIWTIEQPF